MIIYLITGIIVLLFAYLSQFDKDNIGLHFSFIAIFTFLALRYNYGNDYTVYHNLYNNINGDFRNYINGSKGIEIGWVILNRIFKPFGFYSMVAFLALINCIVYFKFIKDFVDKKYYWFAVFIYFFNTYFLLIQLSAMRQCMAIILLISSMNYIFRKKYITSAALIVLAVSFHMSALILIMLIIIFLMIDFRIRLVHIIVIEIIYLSLFMLTDIYQPLLRSIASSLLSEKYLFYLNPANSKPGLFNALTYSTLLFIILKYYNNFSSNFQFVIKLFVVGLILLPAGYILPLSSRLALYFLPFSIIIYPKLLELFESRLLKQLFTVGVISVISIRLLTFFFSSTSSPYYMKYSTIIQSIF